ncbi:DDE-type integrase/transposase/recombinase [Iningainema tapete]|uniref:DDE-type integrase/transposase/recombinase n=1 Tax=Iningainema tapete BLCC-T55 TaxID=2748662 RepID=A0A8J6XGG5_9CYAN|nr:DDE-type integrase/transposase/recombinase [Iningainema tapete]MBD2771304.1 DDE-type integrase/transposase/recombinase [Iningainema tapete BLCC-T55]
MLNDLEFGCWCQRLCLSKAACQVIAQIRSTEPSRRVNSGRGNVSGSYPSHKMGVTIQFESHRNELARIYQLEHDPNVLEYYDQPPPIELDYLAKSGRRNRHQYTPDFFVLRLDSAGWEECKTEQDLLKLAQTSPNRYQRRENNLWHCPPGSEYAQRFGLYFQLWSSNQINWIFHQNFIWLEDYFRKDTLTVDKATVEAVKALSSTNPGITLKELLSCAVNVSPDDIYILIATEQIYVDLNAARLSEPDRVQIFLDQSEALAHQHTTEIVPNTAKSLQLIQVAVGTNLFWDGECWEIVNTGRTTTGLLRKDGFFVELANATFEMLLHQGKIVAFLETQVNDAKNRIAEILRSARPEDIREANRRYELIEPYLDTNATATPTRSIRRWRQQYRNAQEIYGSGYIGLIPHHSAKGNRGSKVDEIVNAFMVLFIEEHYETLKHRRQLRVYQAFVEACESHQPKLNPPSAKTFYSEIKRRSGPAQTHSREGRRAAIQQQPFYWQLELTTPRHGDRPFEIVHIDHTLLDIELVSSLTSLTNCNINPVCDQCRSLGRPWATFMVDAYSRRILAVYLTYEEPSYRSCMMAIRICVSRFKRFPQMIVVDNGPEFDSEYFDQLLAHFASTKKHRPPAEPRFGAVSERLFGTANTQFIHELRGNTQITRLHRQVTKSTQPEQQAVWTLGELYEALCEWAYEVYDQREHPATGQSPRDAFTSGLALGGSRLHRRVEYDDAFHILTLPAPERGQRKVQPGQGVKIHNIYYWSSAFRDPEIEHSMVSVKYDPFDASVAYALVHSGWVKCISTYYQYLQGRSEKEIRLVSTELNKRTSNQGRKSITTDKQLVQFLNSLEAKEGQFLLQRLRASENRSVVQAITGSSSVHNHDLEKDATAIVNHKTLMTKDSSLCNQDENSISTDIEKSNLEYYSQF